MFILAHALGHVRIMRKTWGKVVDGLCRCPFGPQNRHATTREFSTIGLVGWRNSEAVKGVKWIDNIKDNC
jgi:hypothetical protein